MRNSTRVLLFISDKTLMKTLTEDLRRAGYLVDRCESLETCERVNSFYDHDVAFLQADGDDLDTIQAAASFVTPGARIVVVLNDQDPGVIEHLEMHGMQVAHFSGDSLELLELLEEEE
ncbi:MAG TPA: hypothetical protein VGK99_09515 [Acidobacteriota bacterium]|jgi:DNA-binding response OmpR family regulator